MLKSRTSSVGKKNQSYRTTNTIYHSHKDRPDRATFNLGDEYLRFQVDAQLLHTSIYLLGCKEAEVLLQDLKNIDRFAMTSVENCKALYDAQIIPAIFNANLLEHYHLFVRRFALKILCQLIEVEEANTDLLSDRKCFDAALDMFLTVDDNWIVEYAGILLNQQCQEPRHTDVLITHDTFLTTVYNKMSSSPDPDILYQCVLLLNKIAKDPKGLEVLCLDPSVPFEFLLSLLSIKYTRIVEEVLLLLKQLTFCKSQQYQGYFLDKLFYEELFKLLETTESFEFQRHIIDILSNVVLHETICKTFYMSSYMGRYGNFVESQQGAENGLYSLKVMVNIARLEETREILMQYNLVKWMLNYIAAEEINTDICIGIVYMGCYVPARILFVDPLVRIIEKLFNVLKNEQNDWTLRSEAANAICVLMKFNKDCCGSSVDCLGMDVISHYYIREFGDIPLDMIINCTNILLRNSVYPEYRAAYMTKVMAQNLVYAMGHSFRSSVLTTVLITCATAYSMEPNFQEAFYNSINFTIILSKCLTSKSVKLKTAVTDFIIASAKYEAFCNLLIEYDLLKLLLEDDQSLINCENWSPAIEAILANNLPLKFCIRGRLDLSDFTKDNFYISKRRFEDFNTLRKLMDEDNSPRYPIFLVNFDNPVVPCNHSEIEEEEEDEEEEYHGSHIHFKRPYMEEFAINCCPICVYNLRPCDSFLPEYLRRLKEDFEVHGLTANYSMPLNTINVTDIKTKVQFIAEFVCITLSGGANYSMCEPCDEHLIELHLNELKCRLFCNIIPIGHVRIGGLFEKSILFKALADRLGVPSALQLSFNGTFMWNEVAIPVYEEMGELNKCGIYVLPSKLLKCSHVVDLGDNPGQLYPLGSRKAMTYQKIL